MQGGEQIMKKLSRHYQEYFDNWDQNERVKKEVHKNATKYFNDIEFYRSKGADEISIPIEMMLNNCIDAIKRDIQIDKEEKVRLRNLEREQSRLECERYMISQGCQMNDDVVLDEVTGCEIGPADTTVDLI